MKPRPRKFKNLNKILIERLRKYNFQNFSQLLNSPEPQTTYFSYFENIANLIYDTIYDEQSTLETEINQDFDKFSEDCIKLEDSSKQVKTNNNINILQSETKKDNLKLLLDDPIDTYIEKIQTKYERFCINHTSLPLNKNYKKDEEMNKSHIFLNLKSIYESNKDILINIPNEYKIPNEQFKTDPTLLSEPINCIKVEYKGLIEMSTQIDKELEKILGHTGKLDSYIQKNWKPWNTKINLYFDNIKQYHDLVNKIKKKSLENSSVLILKEIKRKNLKRLRKIIIQIKKMKESIDVLKILIADVKKYKTTQELINKSKNNVDKLKKITNKKVSLFELFEISFDNFKVKNSTHMSGELSQILNEYFNEYIYIDEACVNDNEFFNISKNSFDILISTSFGIKHFLEHLQFKKQKDEKEKINSVCEYFIQNNLINSIYIKLRGIFTNLSNDFINKMIDFIRKEIEKKEENQNNNNISISENKNIKLRGEHCLLLCLVIIKIKFVDNVKDFVNEIYKIINETDESKISKIIKNNFNAECQEINNIIDNNMNSILKNQLIKCFDETIINSNIEKFFHNYYFINDLMYQLTSIDEKINNILLDYQNIYIKSWTKFKLEKFLSQSYQSWETITDVPKDYQILLNFYFDFDIKNNVIGTNTKEYKEKMENFERLKKEYYNQKNNDDINDINDNKFLSVKFRNNRKEIEEINIKINTIVLDIIKTSSNIIKLFCLLSPNCYGPMLESFTEILIKHLAYQKEEIFNYKNSSIISQKEVCMTYSIFLLVKYIYEHFKDCDFFVEIMKNSEKKSINLFLSVFKTINESLDTSKKKIEEVLNNNCVDESLKQLNKIQLPNYNIPDKDSDVPVNEYVYTFVSIMRIIYESMLNCYETHFMVTVFQTAIDKFFDKFEYFIFHGKKIENENCLKQFRKDMTFLKKNLNFIDIFDLTKIRSRIDNINKKVLPEHMMKPKRKVEDK